MKRQNPYQLFLKRGQELAAKPGNKNTAKAPAPVLPAEPVVETKIEAAEEVITPVENNDKPVYNFSNKKKD